MHLIGEANSAQKNMKLFCWRELIAISFLTIGAFQSSGVTFSNLPTSVSNTFSGILTLQISGVTPGDTVMIQRYLDVNNSGTIDAADWLVEQFSVTDGQAATIGGITNFNVPGDADAVAGSITTTLPFQPPALNGDIAQDYCANYLFRLSSPGGHFAPITNSLAVTGFPFAQSVSGSVLASGLALPFAAVLALQQNGGPVAATLADGSGHYSLKLPPGAYQLAGIASNLVINLGLAPKILLLPGLNLSTNLNLTSASQTISGRVANTNDASIGLPGFLVLATDTNFFLGATLSDANGNFTIGTRPSTWNLSVSSGGNSLHGYLTTQNKVRVNSGGGSVGGVNLFLPPATAMFYGTVTDDHGNPMPGIPLNAQDASGQFADNVATRPDGSFNAGGMAGAWTLQLNNVTGPLTNYLFTPPASVSFSSNQAVQVNFTGILSTNHLSGVVTKSSGGAVIGVE